MIVFCVLQNNNKTKAYDESSFLYTIFYVLGMSLVANPTNNTFHLIQNSLLHASVVTNLLNSSVYSLTQSGPGNWVFFFSSTCPIAYKVTARGSPDYQYRFSVDFTKNFVSLSQPTLGNKNKKLPFLVYNKKYKVNTVRYSRCTNAS